MTTYIRMSYPTSFLIVEDENGELVELPRDHPLHIEMNERFAREADQIFREAIDAVQSRDP